MAFRSWFPRSLPEQAAFYVNFTNGFIEIAEDLGFTTEDIAELQADTAVMQYLALTDSMMKNFKSAFRTFRINLTRGSDVGKATSYVHFLSPPEPPIVAYGMFDRLFHLADRIVAADGYTPATGARLGILPKGKEPLKVEELVLKLKIKAVGGAEAEVRFKRGRTSGVNLYFQREPFGEWFNLGRFPQSPAIVKIPLLDAAKPEVVYIRGRYLIGNDPAGEYSHITELLIAP